MPEYPAVSVDSAELKEDFVEARESLDIDESDGELYRVRYHPPLNGGDVFEKIQSGRVTGTLEVGGEYGNLEKKEFFIDYEPHLSDDFRSTLKDIESAVEETRNGPDDWKFEPDFWKIDGRYEGVSGAEVAEAADEMALAPKLYLENDLDTDIFVGWFRTAPMEGDLKFGYSAFQNREFPEDSTGEEVLGRLLGMREDERNDHLLKEQEIQGLMSLEQKLANKGLL